MDIVDKIKEFTLDGDGYNSEYNLMLLEAIETIESLRQQLAEPTQDRIDAEKYRFIRDEIAEFKPAGWNGNPAPRWDLDYFYTEDNNLDTALNVLLDLKAKGKHWPQGSHDLYKKYVDKRKADEAIDAAISEDK